MLTKDFLFELGVEEIPAGYIANIEKSIINRFENELKQAKLNYTQLASYTTPKRFAILVTDLEVEQQDEVVEKMGPATRIALAEDGSLTKAGQGFLRGAGCTEAESYIKETPKGSYIACKKEIKGKHVSQIITGFLPDLLTSLPCPKSMKWGGSRISFARPIRNIVLMLDNEVIPFKYNNIASNRIVVGNRYLDLDICKEVSSPQEYLASLESISVIADRSLRVDKIKEQLKLLYQNSDKKIIEDNRLLELVVDLVEYPTAVVGYFEEKYLSLPDKIITSTISQNQKYFSVVNGDGSLSNEFVFISNGNPHFSDIIRKGNEKVIKARLEDAEFFFKEDTKHNLDTYVEKLKDVTFQADLGSTYEKVSRCLKIAEYIIDKLKLDNRDEILRTVLLAKADLVTLMLGEKEFTKLQGYIGMKYALLSGETESVSLGIYEHYMPRGQNDGLPTSVTGAVAAIADKLDTVCGIIGVDLIPTGSNDPFALRRAANGIVKILDDRDWKLDIFVLIDLALAQLKDKLKEENHNQDILYNFFQQRIKWLLEEEKIAYDVIDSVIDYDFTDIAEIKKRALAIQKFKGSADFEGLVLGYKRVSNILTKEDNFVGVETSLFEDNNEKSLYEYFHFHEREISDNLEKQNYAEAMQVLVSARALIDNFFDQVMVNVEDDKIKGNRLNLLSYIKSSFIKIADLDKIVVDTKK
ncbi:glycine--tRNA ligase subunit beta [bacterium]|nr:glycine--tRNA ligase subunit beta [bacterium]